MTEDYEIIIRSWEGADDYLKDHKLLWAVSIVNPKMWGPHRLPRRSLHLEFHDVLYSPRPQIKAPRKTHIQGLLDYYDRIGEGSKVLFHCHAGVSRSTAAALIFLAYKMGPGLEPEAMNAVYEARKCADPNLTMVKLADSMLGRKGALTQAVEEHVENMGGSDEIGKLWMP